MSKYLDYLKERLNVESIETEEGFVTYSFSEDLVYIQDIYVVPHLRKSNIAKTLADKVVEIAKERGITKVLGSVALNTSSRDDSIKVLHAYGMKISHYDNHIIYFIKEV